jgi:hypothetical protein
VSKIWFYARCNIVPKVGTIFHYLRRYCSYVASWTANSSPISAQSVSARWILDLAVEPKLPEPKPFSHINPLPQSIRQNETHSSRRKKHKRATRPCTGRRRRPFRGPPRRCGSSSRGAAAGSSSGSGRGGMRRRRWRSASAPALLCFRALTTSRTPSRSPWDPRFVLPPAL